MHEDVFSKFKKLDMSKTDQLLYQYGVINECGDLTHEGDLLLTEILYREFKDILVDCVRQIDEAENKKRK